MSRSIVRSKINAKYSGGGSGAGGTVTSVGLTMPSAFTVTGSPITTAGSFTVAGAGSASQYIDGTGSLVNFPSLNVGTVTSVGFSAGTGISLSGTNPITSSGTITITNSDPASGVTLTNAGAGASLVNDGTGPSLAIKSLTAGTGISLSTSTTNIGITNSAPDQIVSLTAGTGISTSGTYPSFTITNTAPNVSISVSDEGTLLTSGVTSFNFVGSVINASNLGSAVTVTVSLSDTVSNATLLGLMSGGTLAPGRIYRILDCPYLPGGFWIRAINSTQLETIGTLIETISGTDYYISAWYDAAINDFVKIYEPVFNNTVEGVVNIYNFYKDICGNSFINSNVVGNYIDSSSALLTNASTVIGQIIGNSITDKSVLDLQNSTLVEFNDNIITNSFVHLAGAYFGGPFTNNTITQASVLDFQACTGVNAFYDNKIGKSTILSQTVTHVDDFSQNEIWRSSLDFGTYSGGNAGDLTRFSRNVIKNSIINLGVSQMGAFDENFIISTDLVIKVSYQDFNYNSIADSAIYCDGQVTMQSCTVEGMGDYINTSYASINPKIPGGGNFSYYGSNFRYKEDSTFVKYYDLNDPGIFNGGVFTFELGDELWVGKAICYDSASSLGTFTIQQIVNPNIRSRVWFYKDKATMGILEIDASLALIVNPVPYVGGIIQLTTEFDFVKFEIYDPTGAVPYANPTVVDYQLY